MASKPIKVRGGNVLERFRTLGFLLFLVWLGCLTEGLAEQSAQSNVFLTVTTHMLTSASDSADGDSIPDIWEMRQFGTTYIAQNGTDFDQDGWLDSVEYAQGTDPKNPFDPELPADDNDSIDDNWERQYFGDLGVADDGSDWDGDGLLDKEEYFAGTDPKQSTATDSLQLHNFRLGLNGQMLIDWPTSAETNPCARGYVLVMGSNLAQLINQPIALFTNIGNGTECRATNTMTLPAAFYGIKAVPMKDNRP